MNKSIHFSLCTLFALVLTTLSWSNAAAQQSDYQIQQDFRADYSQIVNSIDNASTSSDVSRIERSMQGFVSEYSDHTDIIDSSLYPETAQEWIEDLESRLNATQQKIARIEEMDERINELNRELEGFRGNLTDMNQEVESLQQQLGEAQSNHQRASGLAREYRESLQERDEFVTTFLVELTRKYQAADASTDADISEAIERLDDNPVDLLRTVLGEYVNYANQSSGLTAPEYLSMKAQHQYFSEWWQGVGEQLTNVFDPDSPVQSHQEVTDLLSNWEAAIDNRIWGAIDSAFADNGIELSDFSNSSQLYNALQEYVSGATEQARNQNSQDDLDRFRNFSNFWNGTVKAQWGDLLIASGILNYEQIAGIDSQLDGWNEVAVPTSNLMLILFLVSIAVIIGLIISLARKRGDGEEGEAAQS